MGQRDGSSSEFGADIARLLFLRSVQKDADVVLKDLRESVLSSWHRPSLSPGDTSRTRPAVIKTSVRALWEVSELDRHHLSPGADDALDAWAARWNLSAPWVTEAGWEACVFWLKHPETLRMGPLEWSPDTMVRLKPVPATDRVLEGWDPSLEPEQAFRQRVEQHVARVKEYAANQGWRAALDDEGTWRFDWLVWYQVLGLGWTEISLKDTGTPTRDTVKSSIAQTAELIGLPLRLSQDD